jgi:hypothetical protein
VLIEIPENADHRASVSDIERLLIAGIKKVVPDILVSVKSAITEYWSKD